MPLNIHLAEPQAPHIQYDPQLNLSPSPVPLLPAIITVHQYPNGLNPNLRSYLPLSFSHSISQLIPLHVSQISSLRLHCSLTSSHHHFKSSDFLLISLYPYPCSRKIILEYKYDTVTSIL